MMAKEQRLHSKDLYNQINLKKCEYLNVIMGNIITSKKVHVCAICNSEDCSKRRVICDECCFVQKFVMNFGRHSLREITSEHERSKRPRVLNLAPPPNRYHGPSAPPYTYN